MRACQTSVFSRGRGSRQSVPSASGVGRERIPRPTCQGGLGKALGSDGPCPRGSKRRPTRTHTHGQGVRRTGCPPWKADMVSGEGRSTCAPRGGVALGALLGRGAQLLRSQPLSSHGQHARTRTSQRLWSGPGLLGYGVTGVGGVHCNQASYFAWPSFGRAQAFSVARTTNSLIVTGVLLIGHLARSPVALVVERRTTVRAPLKNSAAATAAAARGVARRAVATVHIVDVSPRVWD